MSGAQPASSVPDFIDPWPQEEVDRLLAVATRITQAGTKKPPAG